MASKLKKGSSVVLRRIPGYESYWCHKDGSIFSIREDGNAMALLNPSSPSSKGGKAYYVKLIEGALYSDADASCNPKAFAIRRIVAATWLGVPFEKTNRVRWAFKDGNELNCSAENIEVVIPAKKVVIDHTDLPMSGGQGERTVTMTMSDLEKMMRTTAESAASKALSKYKNQGQDMNPKQIDEQENDDGNEAFGDHGSE